MHSTEMRFVSFLSGRFTTKTVANPPERKLAKRTSVQWMGGSKKVIRNTWIVPNSIKIFKMNLPEGEV